MANRGLAFFITNQYNRAVADYTRVLEIKPEFAQIYNLRGNAYLKQSSFEKAIDDYSKALAIDPTSVEAYFNRSLACFKTKKYAQALKDVEALKELGYPGLKNSTGPF